MTSAKDFSEEFCMYCYDPGTGINQKWSRVGKFLAGFFGVASLSLVAIVIPFTFPAFRKFCLPFVPATDKQIKNILLSLENRRGSVIDLGSGDGRVVFSASQKGYISTGVELNIWLFLYSKVLSRIKGLHNRAHFIKKDLWNVNLSQYDNIILFGVKEMMPSFEKKVIEDLSYSKNNLNKCKNHQVIACRFPLVSITPKRIIGTGIDTVWVYKFD